MIPKRTLVSAIAAETERDGTESRGVIIHPKTQSENTAHMRIMEDFANVTKKDAHHEILKRD